MRADDQRFLRNELERLLNEKESPYLDFKLDLYLDSDGDRAEFTKDVLAIANTGEVGHIVTGVHPKTGQRSGISKHHTEERLNQILKNKTDPFLSVEYGEFEIDGKTHGIVRVSGDNPPYIVAVPDRYGGQISTSRRKHVYIARGTVHVRVGTQSIGASRKHIDDIYEISYAGKEKSESIAREFFAAFEEEVANYGLPIDQTWVWAGFYPARLVAPILDRDILSDQSFLENFRDFLMRTSLIGGDRLPKPDDSAASEDSVRLSWGPDPNCPLIVLTVNVFGCVAWGHQFGVPGHREIPLEDLRGCLWSFVHSAAHIYEKYDADLRIATVKVFMGLKNFSNKPLVARFRAMAGRQFTRTKDPRRFPEDPLIHPTSALRTDPEGIAATLTDYVSRAAGPRVRIG